MPVNSWSVVTAVALLGVALLLVVAGVAKLVSPDGFSTTLAALVPRRAVHPLRYLVPLVELVLAAGLAIPSVSQWAAGLATLLFGIFATVLARAVRADVVVSCSCFGGLASRDAPIGRRTVARAAVLCVICAGAVPKADHGLVPLVALRDLSGTAAVAAAGWAAAFLLGVTAILALKRYGDVLGRLRSLELALGEDDEDEEPPGLPVGALAPALPGAPPFPGNRQQQDDGAAEGRRLLLVFTRSGCPPCERITPALAAAAVQLRERVVIVASGQADSVVRDAEKVGLLDSTWVDTDVRLAQAFGIPGTPTAVLIDRNGRIAAPMAVGEPAIRQLLSSLHDNVPDPGVPRPQLVRH